LNEEELAMDNQIACSNDDLLEYRIGELHEGQKNHEQRIAKLEANYMEMKQEFMYVKKESSEQKALTLEIGMKSQDKTEKLFGKLLNSQKENFDKLLEMQSSKSKHSVEVTKGRLVLYGVIITSLSGIITAIINVIFN
jgi:hypothetical protein